MKKILPGGAVGMVGGGQLGRMAAVVARQMGYRVVVLEPGAHSPAGQVADQQLVASYDDRAALEALASAVDTVTLEFENLPAEALEFLEARLPTRPNARALRIAQNRILEKGFMRDLGIPVPAFAAVADETTLLEAVGSVGLPALLKTATLGYDGKGQRLVRRAEEATAAFAELGRRPCILEQLIAFEHELSVVVARDVDGGVVTYPPAENVHVKGILDLSCTPARVGLEVSEAAQAIAVRIVEALEYVGVLAVELFLTADQRLMANEMAPRPHNSGHWSIEACETSQFEQQIRAAVGAPVGAAGLLRPAATANLLGDLWSEGDPHWERLLDMPDVKLHLYGKREARPGRKMGHLTVLAPTVEAARDRVLAARAALTGAG